MISSVANNNSASGCCAGQTKTPYASARHSEGCFCTGCNPSQLKSASKALFASTQPEGDDANSSNSSFNSTLAATHSSLKSFASWAPELAAWVLLPMAVVFGFSRKR